MKPSFAILTIITMFFVFGCTENIRTRNFGGKAEIALPPNRKLVNVTWKDNDLWYLTRPMQDADKVETYLFVEESSWGVWEGSYTIIETKE